MSYQEFTKNFLEMSINTQTITRKHSYQLDPSNHAESYTCHFARKTKKKGAMFKEPCKFNIKIWLLKDSRIQITYANLKHNHMIIDTKAFHSFLFKKYIHDNLVAHIKADIESHANPFSGIKVHKGKEKDQFKYLYTSNLAPKRVLERLFKRYCEPESQDQTAKQGDQLFIEEPSDEKMPNFISVEESKTSMMKDELVSIPSILFKNSMENPTSEGDDLIESQSGQNKAEILGVALDDPKFLIRQIGLHKELKKKFDNLVNQIKRGLIEEAKKSCESPKRVLLPVA